MYYRSIVLSQYKWLFISQKTPNKCTTQSITHLAKWNAELIVEPALGRSPYAERVQFLPLALDVMQRVAAARVRVTIRKGYLQRKWINFKDDLLGSQNYGYIMKLINKLKSSKKTDLTLMILA